MILRYMAGTIITLATVLLCGVAGLAGTWLADRDTPVNVTRVELLTPEVKAGDTLQIKYNVFRNRSCEFHADRFLFDSEGRRETLEDVDIKTAPGPMGADAYITTVEVPDVFSPGPAKYVSLSYYRCNPIHAIWPVPGGTRDVSFTVTR